MRLPEGTRPGDTFEVRTGLYSPFTSHQALLASAEGDERSVRLGSISVAGPESTVTGITWIPREPAIGPNTRLARLNPDGKPIGFGPLTTNGACRITRDASIVTVRPLPDSAEFTLRMEWAKLPWALPAPTRVKAIGRDGQVLESASTQLKDGVLSLTCQPDVFEYQFLP